MAVTAASPAVGRLFALFGAGIVVLYCVYVLTIVATTPDLRLRALLIDNETGEIPDSASPLGVIIRQTPGIQSRGPKPQSGDRLLTIGEWPINHFSDFSRAELALRSASVPPGGAGLPIGTDPTEHELPWLVAWEDGQRAAAITYRPAGLDSTVRTYVLLQSVPSHEIVLSLVWFLCQLGIFGIAAIAFWRRSFDRPVQLFFAMSTVTLGAFVAGFHWWLIAGSFWLPLPFIACALVVPVVTLHFFLEFPHPKPWPWLRGSWVFPILYGPAFVCFLAFALAHVGLWLSVAWGAETIHVRAPLTILQWVRTGVYTSVGVAAFYFLATLAALIHSILVTRNPVERAQVRPIVVAAFVAAVCIAYTLVLGVFSRESFALGGARIPMFIASLVFMLAYAVAIARHKLMLVDQLITRGMWYSIASSGSTVAVSLIIAAASLATAFWRDQLTVLQTAALATLFVLMVLSLMGLRDYWQRVVDRRFYREKYRLDRAMQRMNQAVGRLTEPGYLSERMLSSCCDALQAEWAAVYSRAARGREFRLLSVQNVAANQPLQFTAPEELITALAADPILQRVAFSRREDMTPEQTGLRTLKAEAVHSLELDGELMGLVVLGPKRGGQLYTAEDLTFLTALGQITAVALRCARIHQDIGQLNEELRRKVDRIAQQDQKIALLQAELNATREVSAPAALDSLRRESILGSSTSLSTVLDTASKVAASDTSVLIRGESGTGKELMARAIHENSSRRAGPLISVHCAALAEGLLESELFGHVKGAFTGAQSDRRGRFEMAEGGTLFLDEVGDIPLVTQVKLLRVLQERQFEPVGSGKTVSVNVRLIAATHRNLEQLIRDGRFREDLYYRLNVVSLTLPPLRDRQEDILELAMHFLKRAALKNGRPMPQLADDVVYLLRAYRWPGNVRELENAIERAVVVSDGVTIQPHDLPPIVWKESPDLTDSDRTLGMSTPDSSRDGEGWAFESESAERQRLIDALRACRGNKARAARELGLPRSTFFSKLKKYAITEV